MMENDPKSKKCAVAEALECAYQLMLERIISQPRDKIGVFLYGTVTFYIAKVQGINNAIIGRNISQGKLSTFIHCHRARFARGVYDEGSSRTGHESVSTDSNAANP